MNSEARAEQARRRAHESEQCIGLIYERVDKRKMLQAFFGSRLFGGRMPPKASGGVPAGSVQDVRDRRDSSLFAGNKKFHISK